MHEESARQEPVRLQGGDLGGQALPPRGQDGPQRRAFRGHLGTEVYVRGPWRSAQAVGLGGPQGSRAGEGVFDPDAPCTRTAASSRRPGTPTKTSGAAFSGGSPSAGSSEHAQPSSANDWWCRTKSIAAGVRSVAADATSQAWRDPRQAWGTHQVRKPVMVC